MGISGLIYDYIDFISDIKASLAGITAVSVFCMSFIPPAHNARTLKVKESYSITKFDMRVVNNVCPLDKNSDGRLDECEVVSDKLFCDGNKIVIDGLENLCYLYYEATKP